MPTILLLIVSNAFMTIAWYGHLRYRSSPLILGEPIRWNFGACFGCLVAAVVFAFWGRF